MKKEIIEILKTLSGTDFIYFDEPVAVSLSSLLPPLLFWGVSSEHGRIAVMDADENWHEVDIHEEQILSSVHERLKEIEQQYSIKAS